MSAAYSPVKIPGLVEACGLFGVALSPRQAEILAAIEHGHLLHVLALGRRSGKSLVGALVALYFATLRPDLRKYVRRREKVYLVCVATNQRQSRIFIEQARSIIEGSEFLSRLVEKVSDDRVEFKSGFVIAAFPATSRGGRGWPIALLLLDEAAHMLDTDGNQAAEPIFRALVPSTAQFGDQARVLVASSPFGTDGFFHDIFRQIEKGDLANARCVQHSTLEMRPDIPMAALELERARDPEGFRAEYLAEFVVAGGSFLDAGRVDDAVGRRHELKPGQVARPIGAVDLGFISDSTALAIVGRDVKTPERLRLVLARSWKPELGPLGFGPTLDAIADVCREHGVRTVYIDQHSAIAAVEHLARHGIDAQVVPTTAQSKSQMFADLKTRVYGGELELYDQPDLIAELHRIETVTTPGAATVRIRRLGSSHGDLATAVALACWKIRGTGKAATILNPNSVRREVDRRVLTDPLSRSVIPAVRGIDDLSQALAQQGVPTWSVERGRRDLDELIRRGRS